MSSKSNKPRCVYAITSKTVEDQIGAALKAHDIRVYLIYCLSIETGIPFKYIFTFTVSDLLNKSEIINPKSSDSKKMPISLSLQYELDDYLFGKKPESLAFPSLKDEYNPIRTSTVQSIFDAITKELGIPHMSLNSLRKTYLYHLYIKSGDIGAVLKESSMTNAAEAFAFLGLNLDGTPIENLSSTAPIPQMPTPGVSVCSPSGIEKINSQFSHLMSYSCAVLRDENTSPILKDEIATFLSEVSHCLNKHAMNLEMLVSKKF